MQGLARYMEVMKVRVNNLKKLETAITMTDEEREWFAEHGIYVVPLDWTCWKKRFQKQASNMDEMMRLRKLNCGKRRIELRMIREERTMRVQSDADAGRTGGVIRKIIGVKKGFRMESLMIDDELVVDGRLVTKHSTKHFHTWFYRSPEEKRRDCELARLMGCGTEGEWAPFMMDLWGDGEETKEMAEEVKAGFLKKDLCEEGIKESLELGEYIPTWEEFRKLVRRLNSRSAPGVSGLSYHMVKLWSFAVKKRIYDCLCDRWSRRETSPGWELRWLAPIPKVQDPTLDDLRPLMLVEVMRKIWVGLIMEKIRRFWAKWELIDENQHGFIGGKGTHTAMPHIINCMETVVHEQLGYEEGI